MNSRAKGQRGELELAEFLRAHGITARRGQQFAGGRDSPDVVHGLAGLHIEVKRAERADLYPWLKQALAEAGEKTAVVAHRRNRQEWVAILRLEDLLALLAQRTNLAALD